MDQKPMVDEIAKLTIHNARMMLDRGEISSVDLTKACLRRIDDVESIVRSFTTITGDAAIKQAKLSDKRIATGNRMPLTGIPLQIKDNICTKGIATTCSSKMLEGFIPPYSATVVNQIQDQNGIILGKGNMDEFAMGSSTENSAFFPTRNPWNTTKVPGGSSGGPAAAVASGECIAALGSDTGGSIRQPAALCGVVGLKPTYGLISRYGLIAFASSLDQIGPITKDVTDSAILLSAITGFDPKDSTSIHQTSMDYHGALTDDIKGMRIGIPREYFPETMDPAVTKSVYKAISILEELGASVDYDVSLPSTPYALAVYYIIAPSECSANLARYDGVKYGFSAQESDSLWEELFKTRSYGFGPEVKRRIMLGTYSLSSGYYDAYYLKACKTRTIISREFQDIFQKYDALVTPTSPTTAFNIGEKQANPYEMYLSDMFTIPASMAGIPSISVPCGFVNKMPVGLQIIGPTLSEISILKLAYAYEQHTPWHTMQAKLP